jgi:predicted RNA-binding protein
VCLARVELIEQNEDGRHPGTGELVLDDVAYLESSGDEVLVSTMFGETKVVQGKICSVDFMRSIVTLRPREEATHP